MAAYLVTVASDSGEEPSILPSSSLGAPRMEARSSRHAMLGSRRVRGKCQSPMRSKALGGKSDTNENLKN
ncbi:hypothetical protein K474DRAFT_1126697 [Panus rudis PR-1116 ss-1]|nr:hypothetical protein K474DRAFT_1126697 [Panus rudis PR-1116 ss-1]